MSASDKTSLKDDTSSADSLRDATMTSTEKPTTAEAEKAVDDSANKAEKTDDEDPNAYPQGYQLVLLSVSLCVSVFLVAASNSIVATAIPTITSEFKSYTDIGWYGAGELVTACAFQLPFGQAYSLLNTKWVLMFSFLIYLVGSAICGAAPTSTALIIGRSVAGIGNAGILGGSYIILGQNVPLKKRGLFQGLIGATFTVATVVGPVIGGAFTTRVSWRWAFYFNLPCGVLPIAMVLFAMPSRTCRGSGELKGLPLVRRIARFDPIGTVLVLGFVTTLVLALQWGGEQEGWGSGRVIACFVVFGVTFLAWIATQHLQGENATVPLRFTTNRTVANTMIYALFSGAALPIVVYYTPIWFQSVKGDTAEQSGVRQLALVISVSLLSFLSAAATVKAGYTNPFLYAGTVLSTVGAGLLYTWNLNTTNAQIIGYQILFGVGIGFGLNQTILTVQAVLPEKDTAKGLSAVLFIRIFASAISPPIAQTVLQTRLNKELGPDLVSRLFAQGGATDLTQDLSQIVGNDPAAMQDIIQKVSNAIVWTFLLTTIICALTFPPALLIEWKSLKKESDKRDAEKKLAKEEKTAEGEKTAEEEKTENV